MRVRGLNFTHLEEWIVHELSTSCHVGDLVLVLPQQSFRQTLH